MNAVYRNLISLCNGNAGGRWQKILRNTKMIASRNETIIAPLLSACDERLNSTTFNTERNSWNAGLAFRMDDRKSERNDYRAALVGLRRAQRNFEEFVDTVSADVRRAHRRIDEQVNLRLIQVLNVDENELRYAAAKAQFELGIIQNRDVVEADDDLLAARNDFASAVAAYRNAILGFRLATGSVRVKDDGTWETSNTQEPESGE